MFCLNLTVITLLCCLFDHGLGLTQEYCNLDDDECIVKASEKIFNNLIAGIPSLDIESADPLQQYGVQAVKPTLNYTLLDASLHGMNKCNIESVQPKLKESSLVAYFACPRLTLDSKYDISGKIGPLDVEGKGDFKLIQTDYHIAIYCDLSKSQDKDGNAHISIQSFNLGLDSRRGVTYEWKNLFEGNKEKSVAVHRYVNENWMQLKDLIQEPTMYALFSKFIDNINTYLNKVPLDKLFPKSV